MALLLQMGTYCIYRRRQPGQLNYNAANEGTYQTYTNQPDCANIKATLTQHAQQLVAAGIDHVVVSQEAASDFGVHQVGQALCYSSGPAL